MSNEKNNFITVDRVVTAVVYAFIIGGAWVRLEYKMDQTAEKMFKRIDEHLITDGFEKQIQQLTMTQFKNDLSFQRDRVDAIEEFIKPESPKLKPKYR